MANETTVGCTRPSTGPVEADTEAATENPNRITIQKETQTMIKVGKPVPDFTANGYEKGHFISAKLSDYKGKWVLLCFYPGDFTFV